VTDSLSETYEAMRKESRQRRARNRDRAVVALAEASVPFDTRNNGAHLIVRGRLDYWPGTGKWSDRETPNNGRGIASLLAYVKGLP
jgi:hypothetical protein